MDAEREAWNRHVWRLPDGEKGNTDEDPKPESLRKSVEPWLSAMFQSEHLSLLVGNGFTTALSANVT